MKKACSVALKSAGETYDGIAWIFRELISPLSKREIAIAVALLLTGVFVMQALPLTIKQIVDAVCADELQVAGWWVLAYLLLGKIATVFGTFHDHFRERAWSRIYLETNIRALQKMLERTLGEIVSDSTEIGAEQIESLKDRVQGILYLLFFEGSIVIITIVNATVFVFFFDTTAALIMVAFTIFNIGWFMYFNQQIDERMEPIDKALRRAQRRLVERLTFANSIKVAGVETKAVREVDGELREPLATDLKVWAYWYLKFEFVRRTISSSSPTASSLRAGPWVQSSRWQRGHSRSPTSTVRSATSCASSRTV